MATIRNNQSGAITLIYAGGKRGRLDLTPGVNIGVPDEEMQFIKKHPTVRDFLEHGVLDILLDAPTSNLELEGFTVVDDKKTDEPLPILEAKLGTRPKTERKPKTTTQE